MLALAVSRHPSDGDIENAGNAIAEAEDMSMPTPHMTGIALGGLFLLCAVLRYQLHQTEARLQAAYEELCRLTGAIHAIAAHMQVTLPPPFDVSEAGPGQFLHWENFGVRPTLPDSREVEPERERE